ncbi:MAG: CRISPR-associated endonuclease Cas3'', partial [Thermoproteota archaeon]
MSEHSCKFLSHRNPDVPLKDHLKEVGELCFKYTKKCTDEERIHETARIIGLCHDLGKYTEYFQAHLNGEKVKGDLYKHSRLSAVLTAWLVKKRTSNPFLALASFNCIASHHGTLKDLHEIKTILKNLSSNQNSPLMKQINSITKNLPII